MPPDFWDVVGLEHTLGAGVEDASIIDGVPVCGPNDQHFAQAVVIPDGTTAHMMDPAQVELIDQLAEGDYYLDEEGQITDEENGELEGITSSDRFLRIDDTRLGQLYTALPELQSGFEAIVTLVGQDGEPVEAQRNFGLCREDVPFAPGVGSNSPSYNVYVSPMQALNNICLGESLRRSPIVGVEFTNREILAISRQTGGIMSYCQDPENPGTLFIGDAYLAPQDPNSSEEGALQAWLATDAAEEVFPDAERLAEVREAFDEAGTQARLSLHGLDQQTSFPPWLQVSINVLLSVAGIGASIALSVYLLKKQLGPMLEGLRLQRDMTQLARDQAEENRRIMRGEQDLPSAEERERIFEGVSRDITAQAREGVLDPVLGRDAELARLFEILDANRLTGAQIPALVGERGVGKSALVEGLAQASVDGRLPQFRGWRVIEIDIPGLVAGTGTRGSLETKMRVVRWMIENSPNTFFFMDEVHLIMGAGSTKGSNMDAANILKPTLARRGIPLIVGTTLDEYKTYIMRDPAFESRLSPMEIRPVSGGIRTQIFRGVRDFALQLSRRMDEEAGSNPRRFTIPDEVIEHLGNIVGGNNREIKKTLGRVIARARAMTSPGSGLTITTRHVDELVLEINESRRALGQPELGSPSIDSGLPSTPNPPPSAIEPPPSFTLEQLTELIRWRYELPRDATTDRIVSLLARNVQNDLNDPSRARWVEVDGLRLPDWDLIDSRRTELVRGLEVRIGPTELSRLPGVLREVSSSPSRSFDSLPEEVREIGRRGFDFLRTVR